MFHSLCHRLLPILRAAGFLALGAVLVLEITPCGLPSTAAQVVSPSSQTPGTGREPITPEAPGSSSPMTPRQQRALVKDQFAKLKKDSEEMFALAKTLQDELEKSNQNVLSLKVVDTAEKMEKLAKKIKSEARIY